jgi:hypothetical protein
MTIHQVVSHLLSTFSLRVVALQAHFRRCRCVGILIQVVANDDPTQITGPNHNVINGILCHMAERFTRVIAGLVEIHHGST